MRYTALVKVEFLIVFDFPDQTMTGSLSRHLQKVAILGLPYAQQVQVLPSLVTDCKKPLHRNRLIWGPGIGNF